MSVPLSPSRRSVSDAPSHITQMREMAQLVPVDISRIPEGRQVPRYKIPAHLVEREEYLDALSQCAKFIEDIPKMISGMILEEGLDSMVMGYIFRSERSSLDESHNPFSPKNAVEDDKLKSEIENQFRKIAAPIINQEHLTEFDTPWPPIDADFRGLLGDDLLSAIDYKPVTNSHQSEPAGSGGKWADDESSKTCVRSGAGDDEPDYTDSGSIDSDDSSSLETEDGDVVDRASDFLGMSFEADEQLPFADALFEEEKADPLHSLLGISFPGGSLFPNQRGAAERQDASEEASTILEETEGVHNN